MSVLVVRSTDWLQYRYEQGVRKPGQFTAVVCPTLWWETLLQNIKSNRQIDMGNLSVNKYITTQPDSLRYITLAKYNFHFMISQITPARGKHLDLNRIFNRDSTITLTKFFIRSKDLDLDFDLDLVLDSTFTSTLFPRSWEFKQKYLFLKELFWLNS